MNTNSASKARQIANLFSKIHKFKAFLRLINQAEVKLDFSVQICANSFRKMENPSTQRSFTSVVGK